MFTQGFEQQTNKNTVLFFTFLIKIFFYTTALRNNNVCTLTFNAY